MKKLKTKSQNGVFKGEGGGRNFFPLRFFILFKSLSLVLTDRELKFFGPTPVGPHTHTQKSKNRLISLISLPILFQSRPNRFHSTRNSFLRWNKKKILKKVKDKVLKKRF